MPFFFRCEILSIESKEGGSKLAPSLLFVVANAPAWTFWFRPAFSLCRVLGALGASSRFGRGFAFFWLRRFRLSKLKSSKLFKATGLQSSVAGTTTLNKPFACRFCHDLWFGWCSGRLDHGRSTFTFFIRDMVTFSVGNIVWPCGLVWP